jgi:hypothetical protein
MPRPLAGGAARLNVPGLEPGEFSRSGVGQRTVAAASGRRNKGLPANR